MATTGKRFMLTVPDDIESEVDVIKREMYYDKPYSEVYRQLIRKGLNALKREKEEEESKKQCNRVP